MAKVVFSLVTGLLLIGVILGGVSCAGESETKPAPTLTETEAIKITAKTLYEEYLENEVAADYKYKNHILTTVGEIADISRDPKTNKPYIAVGTASSSYCLGEVVRCFFNDESELLNLAREDEVIIKGKCLGMKKTEEGTSFPILLQDCSLIEETEFQIVGWKTTVTVISGYHPSACLEVSYKKFGRSVRAYLYNPEGREIDEDYSWLGRTEGVFTLSLISMTKVPIQIPMAGDYQIVVKDDSNQNILTTKTVSILGAQPEGKITEVSGHWENDIVSSRYDPSKSEFEPVYGEEYHYSFTLVIDMKNAGGDLPFYSKSIAVKSPNEDFMGGSYTHVIALAPNQEKTISLSTVYNQQYKGLSIQGYVYMKAGPESFFFRSPGEKMLTLEFSDETGQVVYSLNTTITVPEKP